MKKVLKSILQEKGLYYKLRYSAAFRLYQHLFKHGDIEQEKKERQFYQSFLPPCDLIFDIGANDGHKTEAFLSIAKKVISCEPDKANFALLQERFRNRKKRVVPLNKAVSDTKGEAVLYIHHPGSAFNTLSEPWKKILEDDNLNKWNEKISFTKQETVQTVTLDGLIQEYGRPGFLKIDVEGFESKVLSGLSQPIPFISFEALLPDGYDELNCCLDKLSRLDRDPSYNIAQYEKLLLPEFVSRSKVTGWLQENETTHFEIVVKMSTH